MSISQTCDHPMTLPHWSAAFCCGMLSGCFHHFTATIPSKLMVSFAAAILATYYFPQQLIIPDEQFTLYCTLESLGRLGAGLAGHYLGTQLPPMIQQEIMDAPRFG